MDYVDEIHVTPAIVVRVTYASDGTATVTVTGGRWDGYEKVRPTWPQAMVVRDVMVAKCGESS